MSDNVTELTEENFEQHLKGSKPLVVDFWAPWCGPCKNFGPVFEDFAKEHSEKVIFCKVNIDDCPKITAKYGVRSIPTVMLFKNGEVARTQHIGAMTKKHLETFVEDIL